MPRSVPEWVGKTDDSAVPKAVWDRLFDRQGGICACGCGMEMNRNRDKIDCDHKKPLKDGGRNAEPNLQLILHEHHVPKTSEENRGRAKAKRWLARAFNIARPKMQGRSFTSSPIKYSNARGALVNRATGETIPQEAEQPCPTP